MRDTYLVIHILAAGAWFGTNVVQILVNPGISSQGNAVAAAWHRYLVKFGRTIYTGAAILLAITGMLLIAAVDDSPDTMADHFVSIGWAAVIIGAGLGMAFFGPQSRKAAAAYDAGDTATAAAIEKKINGVGLLDTAIVVFTVAAMVGKWGVG